MFEAIKARRYTGSYLIDWRSTTTIEQFIDSLDAYIRWYKEKRIKLSLGYLSSTSTEGALA